MIIKENEIDVGIVNDEDVLEVLGENNQYKNAIFFDLEHYVYKKPKCVGVFGACYYDEEKSKLIVTQYMIENKSEIHDILLLSEQYFKDMKKNHNKDTIVTFSGNNDFTVINYLFNEFDMEYKILENYNHIDLQKQYEMVMKKGVGLKALEKIFNIEREGELIGGSNLAKTFHKMIKDDEYISRIPKEKIEKILLYNEQDVVNLYHIYVTWNKYIKMHLEALKEYNEKEETASN